MKKFYVKQWLLALCLFFSMNVFADEVILIGRDKLFAESANALERYRKRMIQILAILGEIEKTTDGLQNRLHIIATEEPL